jgi:hypothetical protein
MWPFTSEPYPEVKLRDTAAEYDFIVVGELFHLRDVPKTDLRRRWWYRRMCFGEQTEREPGKSRPRR